MRISVRTGTWGNRILTFVMIGIAAVVFGTILLQEVFGVDVEPAIELLATTSLDARQALYLLMGATFTVIGLITIAGRGLPALVRAVALARRAPVPIGDLRLESDAVEVEGTAEPMDAFGTVRSPYSDTECLGYRYEFEERRRSANEDDSDWRVVDSGQHAVPFRVTDGSGAVVVDPEGATLTFDRDVVLNTGRRSRTEWRLEPGESVYVSGRKRDGASDAGAPGDASTYVGAGADGSAFTVSDASESRTILRFLTKGLVLSVFGLTFSGVGLALLYFSGIV